MRKTLLVAAVSAAIVLPSLANAQGFPSYNVVAAEDYFVQPGVMTSGRNSVHGYGAPRQPNSAEKRSIVTDPEFYFPPFSPF